MNTSELAVIDTNVLVYATDETAEFHESAKALRDRGVEGSLPLAVSPQVLMEFFAIITDLRRVTHPRSAAEAREEVAKYVHAAALQKIHPGADVLDRVLTLMEQHPEVTRQMVFDLFLVATMQTNGISRIYTYNAQDFAGFEEITVLTP